MVLFLQSYIRDKGSEHRQVLEVVEMMLEYMPTDRMKLKDAMKHPFFRAVKKQHPNRYPEYTPTPDRESRSKSRRSSRMDDIKEKPGAEKEEENDKTDSACAVQCEKGELIPDLSIDEADDVRMEHILKDEEARTKLEKEREPLQKGINLPALEEEKSHSEPKASLKPPRKYDDSEKDKPKSEESRAMDVFDTEMNLLNMKLKHLREEFQMESATDKNLSPPKNGQGVPPSKGVEDVSANKGEVNDEEEAKKKYKKMSDAALADMNMTPTQLVRQWLQTPSTKSDKSPQGSISPAPARKDLGNVKSSSSPTSSKGDGDAANNTDDTAAGRRRRRRHRQEAQVQDSFDNEETGTDLDARLEARRAARMKKISQDNSQTSSIDDSEASSTTGDQNREHRAAARRLRRNKVVEPDPPPEPKKQEISMRSIFDFFNNKASPDVLKVYPELFTDKNVKSDSVPTDNLSTGVSGGDTSEKPQCNDASIEPSDRTDDALESQQGVETASKDEVEMEQSQEEEVNYITASVEVDESPADQTQEVTLQIVDDEPSDAQQSGVEKDLTISQDSDSSGIQDNYSTAEEDPSSPAITNDSVSACASFMCVPTQSIKFPGEIQTEEATNS